MALVFYATKIMILIAGLVYGGHLMYVPEPWMALGATLFVIMGFLYASKEPPKRVRRHRIVARQLTRRRS